MKLKTILVICLLFSALFTDLILFHPFFEKKQNQLDKYEIRFYSETLYPNADWSIDIGWTDRFGGAGHYDDVQAGTSKYLKCEDVDNEAYSVYLADHTVDDSYVIDSVEWKITWCYTTVGKPQYLRLYVGTSYEQVTLTPPANNFGTVTVANYTTWKGDPWTWSDVDDLRVYHKTYYNQGGGTVADAEHYVVVWCHPAAGNNAPNLTSAYCYPSNGVDNYTTFWFNVTYADQDGDTPANFTVNATTTGYYVNQSVTWVSGDNTTGAVYSYHCQLQTGIYNFSFYVDDGKGGKNYTGNKDGPNVSAQNFQYTLYKCSGTTLYFNSSWAGTGLTVDYNVSADGQSAGLSALNLSNDGNVPINWSIKTDNVLPSGMYLKFDNDSTAPNFEDPDHNITTSYLLINDNISVGGYHQIWLWMDYNNVYGGSGNFNITYLICNVA